MTAAGLAGTTLRPFGAARGALTTGGRADLRGASLPWPALLYLLAVVIPVSFNLGPLVMTLLRLVLIVLIVPLVVRLLTGRLGRVMLTDVLFLAHLLWIAVALAANNPDMVVQQMGSLGVEFLGGYLVGRAYIRTPQDFAALCRILAIIVCCTLPLAIHEALTGQPVVIEALARLPGIDSVEVITYERRMGLERAQVMLAHPILYGLFCSMAFSLVFVALKGTAGTLRRYLMSAVIAACLFLSLSSGALLALALQLALIAWSVLTRYERWGWWLLIGLGATAYVVVDLLSNRTPIQVFMSYATFSPHNAFYRGVIFEWGMKNVWGSPILGIGLDDWVRPAWMRDSSMDNFWLVTAVRFGIPGFLLLAAGYALAVLQVMRRDFRGDPVLTLFRRAWVFTFLGLSFTLCTVHVWTNTYSFVFFMLGAGIWLIATPVGPLAGSDVGSGAGEEAPPGAARRPTAAHTRFPPVPRGGAVAGALGAR